MSPVPSDLEDVQFVVWIADATGATDEAKSIIDARIGELAAFLAGPDLHVITGEDQPHLRAYQANIVLVIAHTIVQFHCFVEDCGCLDKAVMVCPESATAITFLNGVWPIIPAEDPLVLRRQVLEAFDHLWKNSNGEAGFAAVNAWVASCLQLEQPSAQNRYPWLYDIHRGIGGG